MDEVSQRVVFTYFFSDSDHSELTKDCELDVPLSPAANRFYRKHQNLSNSDESLNNQTYQLEKCNSPHTVKPITRSISTSTEKITRISTEDKSTSTDNLEFNEESKSFCSLPVAENHKYCASPTSSNLTDTSKVQFLHDQLMTIQSQSVQERRKFSETRRYWTDLMIANNLEASELHRASSSPSLLGE